MLMRIFHNGPHTNRLSVTSPTHAAGVNTEEAATAGVTEQSVGEGEVMISTEEEQEQVRVHLQEAGLLSFWIT